MKFHSYKNPRGIDVVDIYKIITSDASDSFSSS